MKPRIGMIGIGMMGHGIASNLVRKGWPLAVLEHPGNQPLDDLKAAGAQTYPHPADLAATQDVIILVLTGSPQVEAVLTGPNGVLERLRPGTTLIDCTTAIPASTERMAACVRAKGGEYLDAAMTRTPKEAAEGRLNLLVGGDPRLLDRWRPLLDAFAEHITHVGPVGAGHRMKLLHNFVSIGMVTLLAEAAACAAEQGIPHDVFVDILAKGGGGGVALERMKPWLLARDPSGLRFSVDNARKDLSYYTTMADDGGSAQTIAHAIHTTLAHHAETSPARMLPELVDLLRASGASPVPTPTGSGG